MLEVAVHDDGGVAARELEPRGDGRLLAEIAAQARAADARIDFGQGGDGVPGAVAGAVVDDDDLVLRRQLVLYFAHRAGEHVLLVERGHDHGDEAAAHACLDSTATRIQPSGSGNRSSPFAAAVASDQLSGARNGETKQTVRIVSTVNPASRATSRSFFR